MHALAAALVLVAAASPAPPGARVLDLRVVAPAGSVSRLGDVLGDAPAVVAFWATYCPPCRAEVPALNAAAKRWGPRGLRVLGVALETDAARIADARQDWEMRYDVLRVAPGQDALLDALFPRGLPASAYVAHGEVTWQERVLTDAELERVVPGLLEPPSAPRTSSAP